VPADPPSREGTIRPAGIGGGRPAPRL